MVKSYLIFWDDCTRNIANHSTAVFIIASALRTEISKRMALAIAAYGS